MRERTKLLAASYLEACDAESSTEIGRGAFGSRPPRRGHLWEQGSYWEFERALDQLRTQSQTAHKWFTLVYVTRTAQPKHLSQKKRWYAEQSLTMVAELTRRRGDGNVYVPEEIVLRSEFASEASSVRKPFSQRRAA